MNQNELMNEYFEWMYQMVSQNGYFPNRSFRKLLKQLLETDFYYLIGMDGNRAEDGIDLRYRFGFENDISQAEIANLLDDRPCSVLEMMVALALRCEEHIMSDSHVGNRTGLWFWDMILSLGLDRMFDARYDSEYVDEIIRRFLDHEYQPNGEGGLFSVQNSSSDLRGIEIWYQMMIYLNEIIRKEEK